MLVETPSALALFQQHCKCVTGPILAIVLAIGPILMMILTLSLVSSSKFCMGWVPCGLMPSFPRWNPYKSSTSAISQNGNYASKNAQCRYLFLGHGAHSLPSELKNTPVVAVALCDLFKEQSLSCCRLNSSTDLCFHLIKLQLVCLLVGFI